MRVRVPLPLFKEQSMKALITGVAGQDGFYLSRFLIDRGHEVHGIVRPSSQPLPKTIHPEVKIHQCDITDYGSISHIIRDVQPYHVYNLAAQSFVPESFTNPSLTTQINAVGCLNILEAIASYTATNLRPIKLYQASTSEMYGNINEEINEDTRFNPVSPYATSKLCAHNMVKIYREAYGMNARCGILFNHESPMRGHRFVTQKVCTYVAELSKRMVSNRAPSNPIQPLSLGNIHAIRDWGHARDYVEAMYLMMEEDDPQEYVIATNRGISVEQLCEVAFSYIGLNYKDFILTNASLIRPLEVDKLIGNATKAHNQLGWKPKISFEQMIHEMIDAKINEL